MNLPGLAGGQIEVDLIRGTRIGPGPDRVGEADSAQRGRSCRISALPEKLRTVGRQSVWRLARREERRPPGVGLMKRIPGQEDLLPRIVGRNYVVRAPRPAGSESPLGIVGGGDATLSLPGVGQTELQDLQWSVGRAEDGRPLQESVAVVADDRVARAVHGFVLTVAAGRERRGGPDGSRLLVPQVHGFRRRVGHRVVPPRREPILRAVLRPGVAESRFRDQTAERGIGDHVDPRGRRSGLGPDTDHVFPAVGTEAAQPVEEPEVGARLERGRGLLARRGVGNGHEGREPGPRSTRLPQLLPQAAPISAQNDG